MGSIAQEHSLFEIDRELDTLLDEIEEEIESHGEASSDLMERFQQFCEAHSERADRIGRFLRMMEARIQFCRSEANRLQERARSSERKATQTKYMVMYYLKSRELRKIEGREFTLRIQKNSQDSVRFTDGTQVPMRYRTVAARIDGQLLRRNVVRRREIGIIEHIGVVRPHPRGFIPSAPIGKQPRNTCGRLSGHLPLLDGETDSESKEKLTLRGRKVNFPAAQPEVFLHALA